MKLTILLLFSIFAQSLHACEYLMGTWVSDKLSSYEYSSKNTSATENQLEFIKQAFGYLRVTYSEGDLKMHESEEIDVYFDKKNFPFKFDELISSVEYIKCSGSEVSYRYTDHSGSIEEASLYFVSSSRFWLELDSAIEREYFVRVE